MRRDMPEGVKTVLAVGYWEASPSNRGSVDPRLLVDPSWAGEYRARLVNYLTQAPGWRTIPCRFSICRFNCGIPDEELGSGSQTDGTWAWPTGLPHYVESHGVALPDQFLEHARANDFQIVEEAQQDPWFVVDSTLWENWADSRGAFKLWRTRDLSRERVVAFLESVTTAGHSVQAGRDVFVLAQPDGDIRIERTGTVWVVRRRKGQTWWPYGGAANETELEQFLSSALGKPILPGV